MILIYALVLLLEALMFFRFTLHIKLIIVQQMISLRWIKYKLRQSIQLNNRLIQIRNKQYLLNSNRVISYSTLIIDCLIFWSPILLINMFQQYLPPMGEETQTQQQKLVYKFNEVRRKIVRNRLILVSILNAFTFFSFVFAMAFYQWIWVQFDFTFENHRTELYYFWMNLLYLKQDVPGSQYQSFNHAQNRICQDKTNSNIYCKSAFYSFSFVGYLCFSIFVIAGILQLFDFVKMFFYMTKSSNVIERKDNFRHIVTISTYTVGLSLSIFSILVISQKFYFGISFWICVATLVVFVLVIIYQQFSIRKMIKQSLIQDLIDKQLETRTKKIKQMEMQTKIQKQQGLTL